MTRIWRTIREPLLIGLVWSILALSSVALRDDLGAVLLFWAPSGLAVAAFHGMPRQRWIVLGAVLLPVQALAVWLTGTPFATAFAYSIASLLQALVAASIRLAVLGGRFDVPRSFAQAAGLFAAALVGGLVGAIFAMPFRAEHSVADMSWWYLANVLGILTLTPLFLRLRPMLRMELRHEMFGFDSTIWLPLLGCVVLAMVALHSRDVALMPLLVGAVVFVTVRYGKVASALTILSFGAVATVYSFRGGSPMPFLDAPPAEATLVLQSWMLTMFATVLPIAAMLMKRNELQEQLVERNAQMRDSLALFNLAEETAGIGRWRLDLLSGAQDWSPKMLEMNGLSRGLAPDPGDVRGRLPDGGEELFRQIAKNRHKKDTYVFTYSVRPSRGSERVLRMAMRNEFNALDQRSGVFGVAMDVTEQVKRERALDDARHRAVMLATEAEKLANTDPLTDLPNWRCTFRRLEAMITAAENFDRPLTAILFDIDHFKSVNDTHGHQVGDEVIQQVADIARAQARQSDLVGRIGGEEFVWLIAGTPDITVRQLAERLRANVEKGLAGSRLPRVTISIGLSYFRPGDTCESLLASADAALYAAKAAGRNQVKRAA